MEVDPNVQPREMLNLGPSRLDPEVLTGRMWWMSRVETKDIQIPALAVENSAQKNNKIPMF